MSFKPLAPQFPARSKWLKFVYLVALFSGFMGSVWTGQARSATDFLLGATFNPLAAPPPASISGGRAGEGSAGTTQSQTHVITNDSAGPQTFNLVVESRQSWTA